MGTLAADTGFGPLRWLRTQIFEKKFNSLAGYIFMALLAIGIGYLSAFVHYKVTFLVLGACMFAMVGVCCMLYPYFGYYTTIVISCLIFSPERAFGLALPF